MAHTRTANGAVFVSATLHPDDTTDLVNAASVLPGLETPLDNSAFLRLQDFPVLTVAELQAIAAPQQNLIRTVKDGTGRMLGRFQFRTGAAVDSGAVAGVSYVAAGDLSGVWFSEAYAGVSTGGTNAVTNAARSLLMPVDTPTFQTAKRVRVAVPLNPVDGSASGGEIGRRIDAAEYSFYTTGSAAPVPGAESYLPGIRMISASAQVDGLMFRVRLPRGSFAGASIVYDANTTGAAPNTGVITRPLQVRVWEMPTNYSVSVDPIDTYPSANLSFDPSSAALKWTGYCGANGNNAVTTPVPDAAGVRDFHNRHPALVQMSSGTSTPDMFSTGASAAFIASEEREYMIHFRPPVMSGAAWYVSSSALGVLYKLEVWIDVTNLGAA